MSEEDTARKIESDEPVENKKMPVEPEVETNAISEPANPETEKAAQQEAFINWSFDERTGLLVISGKGEMTNYTYKANAPWYQYKNKIKSIIIENGVTSIGNSAFYCCEKLIKVVIPDSVTSIGSDAFRGCKDLPQITIPDSVTDIGSWAFYDCSGLMEIILSANLVNIGSAALSCCNALAEIKIPATVTNIGSWAFCDCTCLTEITIPKGVTKIDSHVFRNCRSLEKIVIPNSVESIANEAFKDCTSLRELTMSVNTKYDMDLNTGSFNGCKNIAVVTLTGPGAMPDYISDQSNGPLKLKYMYSPWYMSEAENITVTIEEGVTGIGKYAFCNCRGLTGIKLPLGLKEIGEFAFSGCNALAEITIPDTVDKIEKTAFNGCSGLNYINISAGNKVYDSRNNCNAIIETKTKMLIQGCRNTVVPFGITGIAGDAFSSCNDIKEIIISSSITYIGDGAFQRCSDLETIKVDSGNTVYDSRENCNAIIETGSNRLMQGCKNTEIPLGVEVIGAGAFSFQIGLTDVIIPYGVRAIEDDAFSLCKNLSRVIIPSSVKVIGKRAFSECNNLKDVTLGSGVSNIKGQAFEGCENLERVHFGLPESHRPLVLIEDGNDFLLNASWDYNISAHTLTHHKKVQPVTCTQEGNIEYWQCTICGRYYSDEACTREITTEQIIISSKGHTYVDHVCTECKAVEHIASPKIEKIVPSPSSVNITWGKVAGASKYEVLRKIADSQRWIVLGATSKTSFSDRTANAGIVYTYVVRCLNKSGIIISKQDTGGISTMILSAAVVSAKAANSYVEVTWKAVTGASGYIIYCKNSKDKAFRELATINNGNSVYYKDSTAKLSDKYVYYVKAFAVVEDETSWSPESNKVTVRK